MASPKHFFTIFLIALFTASIANARESQFFSKATKEITTQHIPNKEQQQQEEVDPLAKKEGQQQADEPNFIPQTTPNGYGLYGHETGQLPPSATTASEDRFPYKTTASEDRLPYKTEDRLPYRTTATSTAIPEESLYEKYEANNDNYEQNKINNANYDYNKDSYVTDEERGATALGNRYTATSGATLGDRNTYYSGGNSYGNVKQEGMSDTRFMEKGKYFHDIDNEEKYNPTYRYENSRTTASRSGKYNPNMVNEGYYGNNYRSSNYQSNGNSMGRFGQNQEEFQEVQDEEFEP